jgi:hypothetical protein
LIQTREINKEIVIPAGYDETRDMVFEREGHIGFGEHRSNLVA